MADHQAIADDCDAKLAHMRQNVDQWINSNRAKVDEIDIQRFKIEKWWISNFLRIHHYHVDEATKIFTETLEWRKTFGINHYDPIAKGKYLELQTMHIRGKNADGRDLLWMNVRRTVPRMPGDEDKAVTAFWFETHWWQSKGGEVAIVYDMFETGIKHMDLDAVRFMFDLIKYRYPGSMQQIICWNLPWVLNAAWKMIKGWLDPNAQKRIIFCKDDEIVNYIPDPAHRPRHMAKGIDEYTLRAEHLNDSTMSSTGHVGFQLNGHDVAENGLSWPADEEQYLRDNKCSSSVQFTDDATNSTNNATSNHNQHNALSNTNAVMSESNQTNEQKAVSTVDRRAPTSLSGVNSNTRTRELMEWRVQSFNDNCHQDNFVSVSPRDHLTFHAVVSGDNDNIDLIEFILLKNTSDKAIMYKIKTTSPEKFRVRPSCGFLAPNDRTIIRIFLQQSFAEDATKEKFLVAAAQSDVEISPNESFNMDRFAEHWKKVAKVNMFEYRLVCKLADETISAIRNCKIAPASRLADHQTQIQNAAIDRSITGSVDVVESLTNEVRQLRMENRVLLAAMLTLLFILLFIIFHQRSVFQALSSRIDTGTSICRKALKSDRVD